MRAGRCPYCRAEVDFDLLVSCKSCGGDLTRAAREPPPASPPRARAADPTVDADAAATWLCGSPGCTQPIPAALGECPYCQAARPAAGATERRIHAASAFRLRGERIRIDLEGDGPWTIGREAEGAEALQSFDTVSRRHARIERQHDRLLVRDLRSANGTYVDGARVPDERDVPLPAGSHLSLGRSVELTLEAGDR